MAPLSYNSRLSYAALSSSAAMSRYYSFVKQCPRVGCDIAFMCNARYPSNYCCGSCRKGKRVHSERCSHRRNIPPSSSPVATVAVAEQLANAYHREDPEPLAKRPRNVARPSVPEEVILCDEYEPRPSVPEEFILCDEARPVLQALALFRDKDLIARAEAFKAFTRVYRAAYFNSSSEQLISESIHNMRVWLFSYEDSELD